MCAPILLAAAFSGTLAVSDRSELRLRDPGSDPNQASLDLESALDARMGLDFRRASLVLEYTPRFTLWDMNLSAIQGVVLNVGSVRGEWRRGLVRLTLDQSASYGGVNLASLALLSGPGITPTTPPAFNVVPVSHVIQYAASTTTLSARADLRRWTLSSSATFQLSGGADQEARGYLPFQYGPSGELRADWAASHVAHLITVASAQRSLFSSGSDAALAGVEERWHHDWGRTTQTQLAVGASVAQTRAAAVAPSEVAGYPVGEATLEHTSGTGQHRLAFRASARISPMVNPLLGLVDERLQGSLGLTWTHRKLGVSALVMAQQTVPPDATDAVQLLMGEVTVAYDVYPSLSLDGGLRGFAQNAAQLTGGAPAAGATFLQGIVFVGVTLRVPTARF